MIKEEMWIEKHRPKTLDDIIGHETAIRVLKAFVKSGNSMNLLLEGPPGTGKTATALAIIKDLYGENWERNFMELNASDERGIDVVRTKIKNFSQTQAVGVGATFKIILLDEVDATTSFAQSALRRTMERSSSTCRFILACNYANKLIDPIHSRVGVIHFGGLTNDNLKQLITKISEKENVNITPEAVELLIELTPPDGRKIINNLQMCAILGEEITPELVRQIIRVPEKGIIKQILDNTLNGDMDKAIEISTSHIINSGFDINGILKMIMTIIPTLELENDIQSKFYDVIKETEHYINSGDSIHIQFNGMLARMALVSKMSTKEV